MRTEPERELVRTIVPFAPPALLVAFIVGTLAAGPDAGSSAAIGVLVVSANLVAQAFSIAWAARISPTAVAAVGLGGFAVRIVTILLLLLALERFAFFSAVAFVLAVVPATIAVLGLELRQLSGRWTSELWSLPATGEERTAS